MVLHLSYMSLNSLGQTKNVVFSFQIPDNATTQSTGLVQQCYVRKATVQTQNSSYSMFKTPIHDLNVYTARKYVQLI